MELSEAIEIAVVLFQSNPTADDATLLREMANCGIDDATAIRIVQFLPIAFTRFLYRTSGVRFAEEYVVMGRSGQPIARRPANGEPVYREAWAYCERAAASGAGDDAFVGIAACSGGYHAIQDLLAKGLTLAGVVTSPPVLID